MREGNLFQVFNVLGAGWVTTGRHGREHGSQRGLASLDAIDQHGTHRSAGRRPCAVPALQAPVRACLGRWDQLTAAIAAANGHLDVLRWAREHGCPWNGNMFRARPDENYGRVKVLLGLRRLEVLGWLDETT